MNPVVLVKIARSHPYQVVRCAGHQVAFEDLVKVENRTFEPVHRFAALAGQGDFNEDLDRQPEQSWLKPGTIARNDA